MPANDLYYDTVKNNENCSMATLMRNVEAELISDNYAALIKQILADYAAIPYAFDAVDRITVFDDAGSHYMIVLVGWEREETRRVHGALVHLDIIDGKIWVQRDGTEYGIANELVDAGIPKSQIVLAFHPSYKRPHTEFAVA